MSQKTIDHGGSSSSTADSDSSTILASLRAVDAPRLTQQEFSRLYKGKLAGVLDLVAHNIVGRNEVAAARTLIQRNREATSRTTHPNQEDDPLNADARRAASRLKAARIASENTQRMQAEQLQTLHVLEHELSESQSALEDRRLTTLLLSILERKEQIRNERLAEIARMVQELRSKNADQTGSSNSCLTDAVNEHIDTPQKPRPRTEHTLDTLAALQAHTLRISRLALLTNGNGPSRSREAEERLLRAIADSLGSSRDDEKVLASFQQLRVAANTQAKAHIQYCPPYITSIQHDPEDILAVSQRINDKEEELQSLADHSAALVLGCARALQTVTDFSGTTSPALRDAVKKESTNAQGHVDVLRLSVVNRVRRMKTIHKNQSLSNGQSFSETLKGIERTANRAKECEAFLHQADTLLSPDNPDGDITLVCAFMKEEVEAEGKLTKLLERKGKKSEAGRVLVEDIERLISEVGIVARTHI